MPETCASTSLSTSTWAEYPRLGRWWKQRWQPCLHKNCTPGGGATPPTPWKYW